MQEHFLSESANLILSIEQGVFEWKASIPPSSPSNTWCVMISDQCEATLKHYGKYFEEFANIVLLNKFQKSKNGEHLCCSLKNGHLNFDWAGYVYSNTEHVGK